jgi:predicted PurR-regulated permease PerM
MRRARAAAQAPAGGCVLKLELSYRGMIAVGLALVGLFFFIRLWPLILLIVTAFIFMTTLLPYVDWLVRRGLPRVLAVIVILVAIIAVVAGLFALVVPAMVDEFQSIRDTLPEDAKRLEDFLANFNIDVELEDRARNVDWGELVSGRVVVDYGQRIFAIVLSTLTIVFLTVYLLIEAPRLSRFMYQFVPPGREPEVQHLLQQVQRVVGGYIRGQVITSLSISLYTFVVLLAVGAPNAIAFAVLAGFADIIPIVGAALAIIPPTAATFHESSTRAVIVLVLLVLYQQFEDRILVPRVYGQTLNLPPLVVLIAVLAGGELLGIPGVLLALPAAAIARVAFDFWMERRQPAFVAAEPSDEPFAPDEPAPEEAPHGSERRSA